MDDVDAVSRELIAAFPMSTYAMTLRGVREGVAAADDLAKSWPALISPIGLDIRGQLRRVGIMWRIHELCVAGDLPFSSTMRKMDRANWHQLEIKSGKFIGHLTRTDTEDAFPEDRPSRQDERLRNQGDLFVDPKIVPISQVLEMAARLTAWLTYRLNKAGDILHLCWTVPAADVDVWMAHINVLAQAGTSLPVSAASPASAPDPRAVMRFREHIAEALVQQDESSNANDN